MPRHPFNEDRPDHLPVSAEVWDAAPQYSSGSTAMAAVLYQAIKQLEAEVIALRDRR
jgi:hypothetical protein